MVKNNQFFYDNGHLNDMGIATYAERLFQGKESTLPKEVKDHVENCFKCKQEIMELHDILMKDYLRKQ